MVYAICGLIIIRIQTNAEITDYFYSNISDFFDGIVSCCTPV